MTYLLDTNIIRDLMRSDPRAERWLAGLDCESIPEAAGDLYARLKVARQQRGSVLDENDLWVAATALSLRAVLVSRDTDFAGVDGLAVMNLG